MRVKIIFFARVPVVIFLFSAIGLVSAAPLQAQRSVLAEQTIQDQSVRLNQIQVIGTHNSYHAGLAPSERHLLQARDRNVAAALDYKHPAISDQLSAGVRQIELDIFADSQGGRFSHPRSVARAMAAGLAADPDFDPLHTMAQRGFKVMHLQDVDQRSRCLLFVECLSEVRRWSKAHPRHLPIFVLLDFKMARVADAGGNVTEERYTPAIFDALDREILSVFKVSEILTPDQMRGKHQNLLDAIREGGWPTLATARGKIIFLLDNAELGDIYAQGHPGLAGRLLFPNAAPGTPNAAFADLDLASPLRLETLVRQGYLVRTRADADTREARSNSVQRRDNAIASGAQIISTDYPASEPAQWTGYAVSFSQGHLNQCDPVSGPSFCKNELLETTLGER